MLTQRFTTIHWLLALVIITLMACGGGKDNPKQPQSGNPPPSGGNTNLISGDFRGTIISSTTTGKMSPPELLQDKAGNSLMIWQENDGFNSRYLYRYFNASTKTWNAPALIPDLPPSITLSHNSNGSKFMLVSADKTQLFYMIFNGSSWSQKTPITLPETVSSIDKIAIGSNGSGYAIAVSKVNRVRLD